MKNGCDEDFFSIKLFDNLLINNFNAENIYTVPKNHLGADTLCPKLNRKSEIFPMLLFHVLSYF